MSQEASPTVGAEEEQPPFREPLAADLASETVESADLRGGWGKRLAEREAADVLTMRRHWSGLLMGVLVFEVVVTPLIVLAVGLGWLTLESLILETYLVKLVGEIIALPMIVVKFLFPTTGERRPTPERTGTKPSRSRT